MPARFNNKGKTDWYTRIIRRLRSNKTLVICFLLATAILGICGAYSKLKSVYADIHKAYAAESSFDLSNKGKDTESKKFSEDALFDAPYEFYNDSLFHIMSVGEKRDEISREVDGIFVNITATFKGCRFYNYVLKKQCYQDRCIYKLLPVVRYPANIKRAGTAGADYHPLEDQPTFNPIIDTCIVEEEGTTIIRKSSNPGLDILINNNSEQNIHIQKIRLDVHRSASNKFPILEFGTGLRYELPLYNYGFGEATDVKIFFNIDPQKAPLNYNRDFKYTLNINKLRPESSSNTAKQYAIPDLKKFFHQEGVDTGYVFAYGEVLEGVKAEKIFGRFKKGKARITGKIVYTGKVPSGKPLTDSFYFNFLQNINFQPEGGWNEYHNIKPYHFNLANDLSDYPRELFNEELPGIPPKSSLTFPIYISSTNYAYHFFDMTIFFNNGRKIHVPNLFVNSYRANGMVETSVVEKLQRPDLPH